MENSEELVCKVNEHLFISGIAGTTNKELLESLKITCVIDATNLPNEPDPFPSVEYIRVDIDDDESEHLDRYFENVADKIQEHREKGGKTLVHCICGVSRSSTLCLVFLMKYHGMSLREAFTFLRGKRDVVRPNLGFWKQLIAFENKIFGESSVNMVKGKYRELPDVDLKRL